MRNWRVLTAIAAVVLAALAGVLVWKYTDNAKKDAKRPYEMVDVLVADKRVPANTSFASALDAKLIKREQRVKQAVPPTGILTDVSGKAETDAQLKNDFKSLVASHAIVPDQTLVREDFVAQGSVVSGVGGQLETDQAKDKSQQLEAITVTLDDTHAVAGFLNPGDLVNMVWSGDIKDISGKATAHTTAFLLPGVKILAVGSTTAAPTASTSGASTTASSNNSTAARSLITFEVTPLQAEQIVHAQTAGQLTLTLNPPSFKATDFKDPGEIVEQVNLFRNPDGTIRRFPTVEQFLRDAIAAQGH